MRLDKSGLEKRTFTIRVGRRVLLSGGWGRYSLYALASIRTGRKLSVKISGGSKGVIVGANYRKSKGLRASAAYNLVTHRPTLTLRVGKRRFRT